MRFSLLIALSILLLTMTGCNVSVGVGVGVAYPGPWYGPWGTGVYVGGPVIVR